MILIARIHRTSIQPYFFLRISCVVQTVVSNPITLLGGLTGTVNFEFYRDVDGF